MEELDHRDTVTDEAMPPGTFFDLASLHLMTTGTLAQLQALYPDGWFDIALPGRGRRRAPEGDRRVVRGAS